MSCPDALLPPYAQDPDPLKYPGLIQQHTIAVCRPGLSPLLLAQNQAHGESLGSLQLPRGELPYATGVIPLAFPLPKPRVLRPPRASTTPRLAQSPYPHQLGVGIVVDLGLRFALLF